MNGDSIRLLHGPYSTPAVRIGQKVDCEFRGQEVVVGGLSDGLIQWPTVKMKGRRSLIVFGDLARAVRTESNMAVAHHWGVACCTVTTWRRALGVEPMNEGSLRLLRLCVGKAQDSARTPEAIEKLKAVKAGKPAHPVVRAALLRVAKAPRSDAWRQALSRRRKQQAAEGTMPGLTNIRRFTDEEIALLGTDTDRAVATKLGRDMKTVQWKRGVLGIPALSKGSPRRTT
jgi:hypothetical protein